MEADGDNLIDLLAQAQDIVEPASVSMIPATPAWAVAAFILLAGLAALCYLFARHRRATAYRRAALAELRGLRPALGRGEPDALIHLDQLIRRTALATFPRHEVASLTGGEWIGFLNRTGGRFEPYADLLGFGPYRETEKPADSAALAAAAHHWITRHHA